MTSDVLLRLNNIEVVYDRVFLAVKSVSIDVPEGGLVALLGANGAGKSTTLKSISGLLKPERGEVTRGEITFAGGDLLALNAPERVRGGIAHVLEGRRVFGQLTPEENLLAATSMHHDRAHVRRLMDRTFGWFPRLTERAKAKAGYLSGGEQQMLAIGRALMAAPQVLLADELSLGLAPIVVRQVFAKLDEVRKTGVTVLVVEQNARLAMKFADYLYVLKYGRVVMEGARETFEQSKLSERTSAGPMPVFARFRFCFDRITSTTRRFCLNRNA